MDYAQNAPRTRLPSPARSKIFLLNCYRFANPAEALGGFEASRLGVFLVKDALGCMRGTRQGRKAGLKGGRREGIGGVEGRKGERGTSKIKVGIWEGRNEGRREGRNAGRFFLRGRAQMLVKWVLRNC